jgi:hypothetical protein
MQSNLQYILQQEIDIAMPIFFGSFILIIIVPVLYLRLVTGQWVWE